MKRAVLVTALILTLQADPALAWDPLEEDFASGPADPAPDPAPFVIPAGLYSVTDVYAGDVVTTAGNTTRYETATYHGSPGTYARVIDVVGSGASSAFDGASFNARAELPDGRPVGGTYYEDFVLTEDGFVSVNIVFFQDDSATRGGPPAPPSVTPLPTPAPTVPSASPAARASAPVAVPVAPPTSPARPHATPRPTRGPDQIRTVTVTAGVALGQYAPALATIEVLRGRTVHLWPRAFVDGAAVAIRSWRLVSVGTVDASRTSGGPNEPCDVSWSSVTPSTVVRFEVTTDAAPGRVLSATLVAAVRSPALIQ